MQNNIVLLVGLAIASSCSLLGIYDIWKGIQQIRRYSGINSIKLDKAKGRLAVGLLSLIGGLVVGWLVLHNN